MTEVFPHGCCLVPDSITEAQDYDEKTKRRTPSVDKVTGTKVWQCRVSDLDPDLAGRSRETMVKILADRMPVPPTRQPFELVEFDGLVVTAVRTVLADVRELAAVRRPAQARPRRPAAGCVQGQGAPRRQPRVCGPPGPSLAQVVGQDPRRSPRRP